MAYFDVDPVLLAFGIAEMLGIIIIAVSALIYIILMFKTRHFRFNPHAFVINYCLGAFCYGTFYLCYSSLTFRNDYYTRIYLEGCNIFYYFLYFVNCFVIYSFGGISINRLCMIVFHNKREFKTNKWIVICITGSWILTVIVPLPYLLYDHQVK